MTLSEFKLFSEMEQDEMVLNHGIYLTTYVHGHTMFDVYKMDSFFVKLCNDLTKNKKPSIIAFSDDNGFNLFNDVLSRLRCN